MKKPVDLTPKATASNGCSHTEIKSIPEITQEFLERELESQKKKEFGRLEFLNSLNALFVVVKAIANQYEHETFSFNDFANYAKPFDLPYEVLRQFFANWIDAMRDAGRVKSVPTCYNEEIFQFV